MKDLNELFKNEILEILDFKSKKIVGAPNIYFSEKFDTYLLVIVRLKEGEWRDLLSNEIDNEGIDNLVKDKKSYKIEIFEGKDAICKSFDFVEKTSYEILLKEEK